MSKRLGQIIPILKISGCPFEVNSSLERFSWISVGVNVDLLVAPETLEQLETISTYLIANAIPFRVFGFTSNVFFTKESGSYTCVISTRKLRTYEISGDVLTAACGASLSKIGNDLARKGFSGFENVVGIPATIGGAVTMNAGSFGTDMKKILIDAEVLTPDGKLTYTNEELEFGRRTSRLKEWKVPYVILSARFQLGEADPKLLKERINYVDFLRKTYQEKGSKNLGTLYSVEDFYGQIASAHPLFYVFVHAPVRILEKVLNRLARRALPSLWKIRNEVIKWVYTYPLEYKVHSTITLNTFVNEGQATPNDFLKYTSWLESISKGRLNRGNLENEGVDSF